MMKITSVLLFIIISLIFVGSSVTNAQERTVGLIINEDSAFVGYTLFAPMPYNITYLIDNNGLLVHSWQCDYRPRFAAGILENGNLLRAGKLGVNPEFTAGGAGGIIQEISWDGSIVWEFEYSSSQYLLHHDFEHLPNGNVLLIAWEYKSGAEAIAAGRNPNLLPANKLWPDHIIEVEPDSLFGGIIVWEWHVWDHLIQDFDSTKANYGIVADHPELLDINFVYNAGPDWNHTNSIDYNAELDQILLSMHGTSEILIIDHSTTTLEAAGHTGGIYGRGGDFLYRWGNPAAYRAGNESDRKFFKQHDARWIEPGLPGEGNMMVFNNGTGRPGGNYSSIDEIVPPLDSSGNYILTPGFPYGPDEPVWIYTAEIPSDFYSRNLSGAHRLSNGNTLICSGQSGTFFEITANGDLVWLYINPVTQNGPMTQGDSVLPNSNLVFRTHRYAPDYPGFDGQNMTPGDPIELYPTLVADASNIIPGPISLLQNYPNPFNAKTTIEFVITEPQIVRLAVYDLLGQKIETLIENCRPEGVHNVTFDASGLSSGVYFYRLQAGDLVETKRMVLLK
jgi:hypothetical protein